VGNWAEREKQGSAYTPSGVCQEGKPPAFGAMQDRKSAESFSRSLHGSNACVRRVTRDGYPGLARSRDCAAQWIYGGPPNPPRAPVFFMHIAGQRGF